MQSTYDFEQRDSPLLVSIPHAGTFVPTEIMSRLTDSAQRLPDTDWHLDRLYSFVTEMGASRLCATHSRYVVDLNRPPNDERLYETATTGLIPSVRFDGTPIYRDGDVPEEAERLARREKYYDPYHAQITSVLEQIKQRYGFALLFDAHSILSEVPRLFDGVLPDLNVGTNDGKSADGALVERIVEICEDSPYSTIVNGRFRGGYITRHYGQPKDGVHAIQLEMPFKLYMKEDGSFEYDEQRANALIPTLRAWVDALLNFVP